MPGRLNINENMSDSTVNAAGAIGQQNQLGGPRPVRNVSLIQQSNATVMTQAHLGGLNQSQVNLYNMN